MLEELEKELLHVESEIKKQREDKSYLSPINDKIKPLYLLQGSLQTVIKYLS